MTAQKKSSAGFGIVTWPMDYLKLCKMNDIYSFIHSFTQERFIEQAGQRYRDDKYMGVVPMQLTDCSERLFCK